MKTYLETAPVRVRRKKGKTVSPLPKKHNVAPFPILDRNRQTKLAEDIRGKSKRKRKMAIDELVTSNMRLVFSFLRRHQHLIRMGSECGFSFEDLVQEGNIGIITAAERYNGNYAFSTYAHAWIFQGITRALANAGSIRLPVHIYQTIKYLNLGLEILRTGEKDIMNNGIGKTSRKKILAMLKHANTVGKEEAIREYENRLRGFMEKMKMKNILSLDMPLGDEEDGFTLYDSLGAEETTSKEVANRILIERIMEAAAPSMQGLGRRKYGNAIEQILQDRYLSEASLSLEDVGKSAKKTRERIRQLELVLLRKLSLVPELQIMAVELGIVDKRKIRTVIEKQGKINRKGCLPQGSSETTREPQAEEQVSLERTKKLKKKKQKKEKLPERPALELKVPRGYDDIIDYFFRTTSGRIARSYDLHFGSDNGDAANMLRQEARYLRRRIIFKGVTGWFWRDEKDRRIICLEPLNPKQDLLEKAESIERANSGKR